MDWTLKIAFVVFSVCLIVAVVLGLCLTWGLFLFESTWRMLGTAIILGMSAGLYIGLRDTIQRNKKG